LRFLLLPPFCCLASASLSLGSLWLLGIVAGPALPSSWFTWWVGDTLGVLIVLPLLLVPLGEPRALWRSRARPMALPMLLFFGFFVVTFIRVSAWENNEQLLEFRVVSLQVLDKIRIRLGEQEIFLDQLERSFSRATPVTAADFAALVGGMVQRFPMLQAVEWAPRVAGGERNESYPVTYVEPLAGNETSLGTDLLPTLLAESAVIRALDRGMVAGTRPIRLARGTGRQAGIMLLRRVRSGGSGPGLVVAVLRMATFADALLGENEPLLLLRIVDTASEETIYDSFPAVAPDVRYRQDFEFGLRHYRVESAPTAAYLARKRGWQSWLLLAAGVLGTGLLGALLLLGTGYAHRIRIQVEERTRDLADANRQLRIEMAERQNAEAALRQAQRMEAIGRLTGGIAHDFNNLLMVVSANAELLRNDSPGSRAQRCTAAILRAAARGERLTRQLLTFSRRQSLRPEAVDLRQRTGEIAEMLSRTLRGDIAIALDLPEGLWPASIDPGEFDLAILNIAVNARDAMPKGGRFRVAARNRTIAAGDPSGADLAGDFVELTLSDTGSGMTPEVLARAFDPYFTTKAIGAGSGLGLSQVYGFARQSGGNAVLVSEPGGGAGVILILPRAPAAVGPSEPAAPDPPVLSP
jgi:signal transduction histidine kinase